LLFIRSFLNPLIQLLMFSFHANLPAFLCSL